MKAPVIYPPSLPDRICDAAEGTTVYLVDQTRMNHLPGDPWLRASSALDRHVTAVNLRTGDVRVLPMDTPCAVVELDADVVGDDW